MDGSETRPYTTIRDPSLRASSRARRTSVRGQECCYVRKQGGTLRDFQGGVRWSHPKFRFHPKRVRCPGELSGNSLRARRSGVDKKRFGGTAEAVPFQSKS